MDKQQIGKLIIELRKQNNMRQKELAEKMCVSASAVSKWESGTNLPDTATLIALTEIFHISENAFLHPEETLKFELSVVCPTYTTQDAIHEYADHLFEEWIDGAYASDADAVRIEFYTDAEAASRWTFDTINSITLIK